MAKMAELTTLREFTEGHPGAQIRDNTLSTA
jgi:hypothetical protein